jgi:CRISPR-associated endoribonuclease Cas6
MGFSGVVLRAAFLDLLRNHNKGLSDRVHGEAGPRAYSIDPFPCDGRFRTCFEQGEEYDFGVYLFRPSRFQGVLRDLAIKPDHEIRVLHHFFPLNRVDIDQTSPECLMEQWLEEKPDDSSRPLKMRFHFETPTQFSSFGSDYAYLLPTPEKLFSGTLKVWKTLEKCMTPEMSGSYRDWITRNIHVSGHRLRTVKVPVSRRRSILGFVGNVEYTMKQTDESLANLTFCLARFAELSHVGKNRSAGFGKVRLETFPKSREG